MGKFCEDCTEEKEDHLELDSSPTLWRDDRYS